MRRSTLGRGLIVGAACVACTGLGACQTVQSIGTWHRADITDFGELVVFRLEYPASYEVTERPAVIREDYAVLIDWDDEPDKRRFLVYDRPRERVFSARDFSDFLRAVEGLPHGVTVGWVDTCCAPISYGIGKSREARLAEVLAAGNRRLLTTGDSDRELIICTCESIRLRFPDEPGR